MKEGGGGVSHRSSPGSHDRPVGLRTEWDVMILVFFDFMFGDDDLSILFGSNFLLNADYLFC